MSYRVKIAFGRKTGVQGDMITRRVHVAYLDDSGEQMLRKNFEAAYDRKNFDKAALLAELGPGIERAWDLHRAQQMADNAAAIADAIATLETAATEYINRPMTKNDGQVTP